MTHPLRQHFQGYEKHEMQHVPWKRKVLGARIPRSVGGPQLIPAPQKMLAQAQTRTLDLEARSRRAQPYPCPGKHQLQ